MTHAPRKIIIDTDPGQDDAIALLLAAASPELELLGVTTVAGNVPQGAGLSSSASRLSIPAVPTAWNCSATPSRTWAW